LSSARFRAEAAAAVPGYGPPYCTKGGWFVCDTPAQVHVCHTYVATTMRLHDYYGVTSEDKALVG
jgi:hypothetical protein